MSVIYKYPIDIGTAKTVRSGSVIHFGKDPSGTICIWIQHYEHDHNFTEFYIVGTGHEFNDDHIVHGSVIDGSFVWHLVENWDL